MAGRSRSPLSIVLRYVHVAPCCANDVRFEEVIGCDPLAGEVTRGNRQARCMCVMATCGRIGGARGVVASSRIRARSAMA